MPKLPGSGVLEDQMEKCKIGWENILMYVLSALI